MDTKDSPAKDKKKLLIILLIVVLVPVILLVLQLFQPQEKQAQGELIEPTAMKAQITTPPQMVSPTVALGAFRWDAFEGKTFRMQYPPEWTASPYPMPDGAEAVIVKPTALGQANVYPQFILQTEPATTLALGKKEGILAGFGMTKSDVIVEGTQAIKYKGTIPFKTSGNQTVNEPIQDTTIILQKNNTLYLFKYEYEGSTVNQTLDDYFNGFIKTFRSKK